MLHIIGVILTILGLILKIILFIIAFLIVALLVILLIVLFVPIRYQLNCCHIEKDSSVSGKIAWFFHLLSFQFSYKKGKGLSYSFRVMRFALFGNEIQQNPRQKKTKRKKNHSPSAGQKNIRLKDAKTSRLPVSSSVPENSNQVTLLKKVPETEKVTEDNRKSENNKTPSVRDVKRQTEYQEHSDKGYLNVFQKFCLFLREKWNRFKEICFLFKNFIQNLIEKGKDIKEKFLILKKKISYYLEILKSKEMTAYLKKAKVLLIKLLKHVKPRKAKGYLHYGLEDPSMTGILTGILYLLQPVNMQGILLKPDFDKSIFQGDFMIAGHIRLCHVFMTALRLFFDKNRKIIWKRLRKGGK